MTNDFIQRRLIRLVPAAVGLLSALGVATPAPAQRVDAERAPAAWMAYAQTVSETIRSAISGEEPAAVRFKAYLDASRTDPGQSPPTLALKLWIDARGIITRAEFAPFAHEQANSDLTGLLVNRAIGSAPPKGMLLPLRLSVQLQPAPAKATAFRKIGGRRTSPTGWPFFRSITVNLASGSGETGGETA